ncbi:MAG: universal stress protein [Hyphomicrobiales bacterium]|nr:universal stress protein [Hyphomicrobiales bacterium]
MKRFHNILFVKTDGNDDVAFVNAVALAVHNRASLTLVKTIDEIREPVYGVPEETIRELEKTIITNYRDALEALAKPHRNSIKIEIEVLEGIPFLSIIQEVMRNRCDLIIKSAKGDRGPVSRFFNTIDMHLLRKSPCPVWLFKPDQPETISRIVAAVDFDEPGEEGNNQSLNKQILEMAISLASRERAELHIVHAWQAIAENVLSSVRSGLSEQKLDEYIAVVRKNSERHLSQLMESAMGWVGQDVFDGIILKIHAIKGQAQGVVIDLAQTLDADLLVMGTVGRTGIPGFFIGNTAETILNGIDCSVLAVKPAGFISPVEPPKSA